MSGAPYGVYEKSFYVCTTARFDPAPVGAAYYKRRAVQHYSSSQRTVDPPIRVTPSGRLDQYLLSMTWTNNAVGSGESLYTVFELVLRNRSYVISGLFVSNSCLAGNSVYNSHVRIALALHSWMDESRSVWFHDVHSYVFTLIRKNVSVGWQNGCFKRRPCRLKDVHLLAT